MDLDEQPDIILRNAPKPLHCVEFSSRQSGTQDKHSAVDSDGKRKVPISIPSIFLLKLGLLLINTRITCFLILYPFYPSLPEEILNSDKFE